MPGANKITAALLKQLRAVSGYGRDQLLQKITAEYGEGFARLLRAEISKPKKDDQS